MRSTSSSGKRWAISRSVAGCIRCARTADVGDLRQPLGLPIRRSARACRDRHYSLEEPERRADSTSRRPPPHRRAFHGDQLVSDRSAGAIHHAVAPGLPCEPVFAGRVLGIDPGLTRCGYAVVDGAGPRWPAVALGVIRTPAADPLPQRLAALRAELAGADRRVPPDAVAVEHVFFQVNVRTAMSVGQASGLALAEAAAAGCEVAQYTPEPGQGRRRRLGRGGQGAGAEDGPGPPPARPARRGRPTPPTPRRWRCATWRWRRCAAGVAAALAGEARR